MTTPAISVILPCYNAHAFLPRTLDSLQAQTFRDFETIIVNDGSTEPETLAYLETVPGDIRIVHQENRGLSGARNRGFEEALAGYVLPLDCDDWIDPNFLEEAHAALETAASPSFAFADLQLEGEAAGALKKPFNLFEQLFFNQLPYCMLMPRSAWADTGGYDEDMRHGYEDWEFNIRLGLNGYSGIPMGKPYFHYHVSSSGMLASTSRSRHVELWRFIRDKHAPAYRLRAVWRTWAAWRKRDSVRALWLYLAWDLCYRVLPDAALMGLFRLLRPLSHSAREARRNRSSEENIA